MSTDTPAAIVEWLADHRDTQIAFLSELVKIPSDNPPGDCAAHAAKPHTGHDALEAANRVLTGLYRHRDELAARTSAIDGIGSPSLTVGLIEGGINTNVVPDRVTLRLDRRLIPEEDPAREETALRDLICASIAASAGIRVDIRRVMLINKAST